MLKPVHALECIGGWEGLCVVPNGSRKPHYHWGSHTDVFSLYDVTIMTLLF